MADQKALAIPASSSAPLAVCFSSTPLPTAKLRLVIELYLYLMLAFPLPDESAAIGLQELNDVPICVDSPLPRTL